METIKNYLDKKAVSCSEATILNDRKVLTQLEKFKPLQKITEKDLIKFFTEFKGADSTKNLFIIVIKKFFKENGKEDMVKFLKPIKLSDFLKEEDILTTNDINKLIQVSDNHYFQALISFLFETGCRIGEAHALRYKDFTLTTDGYIVNIPSFKTKGKFRKLILPFSTKYIQNLKLASFSKDDDFVFGYTVQHERTRLHEIGLKAQIGKPVHPHAFRHAQATESSRNGYTEQQLKKKFGWAHGSKMADRYTHLTDDDIQSKQLEVAGRSEPTKRISEKIIEAEPLKIYQAADKLFELEDENQRIHSEILSMENTHQQDIRTLLEEIENMKKFQAEFYKNIKKGSD